MDAATAHLDTPDLIDAFRAAHFLDLSHGSLLRLVKDREVPCYVLPGDVVKFDRRELRDWLLGHRQDADRVLLPPAAAAEVVGLTVSQLTTRANRGELPTVRLPNGGVRYDLTHLRKWLATHKAEVPS